jgi:hypothetical protein
MHRALIGLVTLLPLTASAAPKAELFPVPDPGSPRSILRVAADNETLPVGEVSNIIFLNRCVGGCTITWTSGVSDARTNLSTIPRPSGSEDTFNITEFAHGDAKWTELVACVREVYAPYNVVVTDQDPGTGVVHHECIVAGEDGEINWTGALGIGTVSPGCSPYDNGISYAFANAHSSDMLQLCWTVAQETAHTYGLDHAFDCYDPMTYIPGCGQKFFMNENLPCGEDEVRACRCGGSQNSHARLLDMFDWNSTPLPVPTVSIAFPTNGSTVTSGFNVFVSAFAKRGVSKVELWLNGYKWLEVPGKNRDEQDGPYNLLTPGDVPDGVIDVEVRAWNDLETDYASTTITVTKGAPCTSPDQCALGQACDAGKCFWEPAVGEMGDPCDYAQACISGVCNGTCTLACFPGVSDQCPEGHVCEGSGNDGFCVPGGDTGGGGGCCSSSGGRPGVLVFQLMLAALIFGFVIARRRRSDRI